MGFWQRSLIFQEVRRPSGSRFPTDFWLLEFLLRNPTLTLMTQLQVTKQHRSFTHMTLWNCISKAESSKLLSSFLPSKLWQNSPLSSQAYSSPSSKGLSQSSSQNGQELLQQWPTILVITGMDLIVSWGSRVHQVEAQNHQRQYNHSYCNVRHRQNNVNNALTHNGQHKRNEFYSGMTCTDPWYFQAWNR